MLKYTQLGVFKSLNSTRRLVHPTNDLSDHSNRALLSPQHYLGSNVVNVSYFPLELLVVIVVEQLLRNKIEDVANAAQPPLQGVEVKSLG